MQSTPSVTRVDCDRYTFGSAGAMTDLAKCAKSAPGNLNRATHAAISATELSLRVVHPFHT